MQILPVLVSIVIAVSAITDNEQWISFKNKYGKTYKSLQEDSFRFNIFQDNLRKIESHNERYDQGEETYMMGITQFVDITTEEFLKERIMPDFVPRKSTPRFSAKHSVDPTPTFDWREKGAVLEVENQGNCGSCWAFSAIGALEGQNAIKHNQKIPLSPQELVDCNRSHGNRGCNGGWMDYAFEYVQYHGISALTNYEYTAVAGTCKNDTAPRVDLKVTSNGFVDHYDEALRQAVENIGPISVAIFGGLLQTYKKGIMQHPLCPIDVPTHAVLVVGYGTENGTDYWILKNSYGKDFGEDGYFRLARNKNNMCGVCSYAMYPIVA